MPEAIADRQALSYTEESVYGETPTTPVFERLRHTGESLKQDTSTVDSQEIRSDRQVSDHRRVNIGASGETNFELSYGAFDDLLEAALMSEDWTTQSTPVSGVSTVSFESISTSATSYAKILDSGNGLALLITGSIITISGAAQATNNSTAKVISSTAAELEVVILSETADLIDESAGASITLTLEEHITNNVVDRFFTVERHFTDINEYIRSTGMQINTTQLQLQLEERITGSFSWMGSKETTDSAVIAGSTYNDAPTNEIFTVVDNVTMILEDGQAVCLTQFNIEISNELRQRQCIGSLGAKSVGAGKFRCSGGMELYLKDRAFYDKYLNFASTNISIAFHDSEGNKYVLDIPEVRISDASANASGESSDVMITASWTGILSRIFGYTLRIARIPA